MSSIDSGSFGHQPTTGILVDIFADQPGWCPVLNKSYGLDFYDLLYFDQCIEEIVKEIWGVL